ncbi:hypothetical protein FQN51_003254 [Onygenales sp. PD_10]|nr:hypothetical protein FQN51_003254 [Onygenales sp. PD_10]
MEALGAVGLASNVVQLLDFGIRLVAKTNEIHNSAQGEQVRNIELDAIAQNLVSLNRRVQNRSRKVCAFATTEDEMALKSLTEECNRIGEELINALQAARVQGVHGYWKSVRQALKSTLGRDKIEDLYDRLRRYREQIVVVLLVITNAKQMALGEDVQDIKSGIHNSESRVIDETRQTRFQILDAIRHSNYNANKKEDVATVSDLLSQMSWRLSDQKYKEDILESLYYPNMQHRREFISNAHKKTFNWTLDDEIGYEAPWDNVRDWLRKGDGIYWLSGKAGSGKSTLMKYIDQDQRTLEYLQEWASPVDLIFASFYFWNPGTSMQKSQLGLLQSLLHKILSQRSDLIPKILPSQTQFCRSHGKASFSWTISDLEKAFQLLSETYLETQFCFLIDGLDEFDGDHKNLVDLLFDMTRNGSIKILAASRPWLLFQDAFRKCPKLTLQDLTRKDIEVFAHDSLYNHPRFSRLLSIEPERAPKLVTEIVNKASGVFLWVYLVVRSLMEGLTNADRMVDLQRRLEELPVDLEQFFLHMLTSLDPFYLKQASQLFRLALEAPRPLEVLTFSYLDEYDPDFALKSEIKEMSKEEEAIRCEEIERRLNSRCKGLIESRRRASGDAYSNSEGAVSATIMYEVDFLHRTVRDFLGTPTVQVQLVAPDTSEFDGNMALARAYVARIKGLRNSPDKESNFWALWSLVFDMMCHIGRVGDGISVPMQADLLDEMDRAAGIFRTSAIVKRRCPDAVHWVNTGYRFGFDPAWNNDFITLCVQYDLVSYIKQKPSLGSQMQRPGKPLLAFAMTAFRTDKEGDRNSWEKFDYMAPRVKMVRFLLESGANPNDMDGDKTVWVRCLVSMYQMCVKLKTEFSSNAKTWFEISKLLLLHGADPLVTCGGLDVQPEKMVRLGTLRTEKPFMTGQYTATDIIYVIFGGDSGFDIAELEDLMEPEKPDRRIVSDSYLQPPGSHQGNNVSRTHSATSSISNTDGRLEAALHPPPVYRPILYDQPPSTTGHFYQAPTPAVTTPAGIQSVPPPKGKKHSRLSSLFTKIRPKEKTPPRAVSSATQKRDWI